MKAEERAAERDRLAVAELLMALRGVGVEFPGRLFAAVEVRSACPCRYKDLTLLGFRGTLLANVDLPDGFGIGRATSHGYGWLSRAPHEWKEEGAGDEHDLTTSSPGA
jgi:hypothetical protein